MRLGRSGKRSDKEYECDHPFAKLGEEIDAGEDRVARGECKSAQLEGAIESIAGGHDVHRLGHYIALS